MSTSIEVNGKLIATEWWGGTDRGPMITFAVSPAEVAGMGDEVAEREDTGLKGSLRDVLNESLVGRRVWWRCDFDQRPQTGGQVSSFADIEALV